MNRRNGSTTAPPGGIAKGMGDLTRDIVSLAALEFELFQNDCRDGLKRLLIPAALLLVAGTVALGTVPIALILMAELLIQPVGLSRAAAYSIAALIGLTVSAAMGVVGWYSIRGVASVFERSREEWTRNSTWIRLALKGPPSIDSQQPEDRRHFPLP